MIMMVCSAVRPVAYCATLAGALGDAGRRVGVRMCCFNCAERAGAAGAMLTLVGEFVGWRDQVRRRAVRGRGRSG